MSDKSCPWVQVDPIRHSEFHEPVYSLMVQLGLSLLLQGLWSHRKFKPHRWTVKKMRQQMLNVMLKLLHTVLEKSLICYNIAMYTLCCWNCEIGPNRKTSRNKCSCSVLQTDGPCDWLKLLFHAGRWENVAGSRLCNSWCLTEQMKFMWQTFFSSPNRINIYLWQSGKLGEKN